MRGIAVAWMGVYVSTDRVHPVPGRSYQMETVENKQSTDSQQTTSQSQRKNYPVDKSLTHFACPLQRSTLMHASYVGAVPNAYPMYPIKSL